MSTFVIILASGIDETQRTLIHAQVKKHADAWWHEMPDVWLVQTDEIPTVWQKRLVVFIPHSPAFLLTFALPEGADRKWGGAGARPKWQWIYENYATPGGKTPQPLPEVPERKARPLSLKT